MPSGLLGFLGSIVCVLLIRREAKKRRPSVLWVVAYTISLMANIAIIIINFTY